MHNIHYSTLFFQRGKTGEATTESLERVLCSQSLYEGRNIEDNDGTWTNGATGRDVLLMERMIASLVFRHPSIPTTLQVGPVGSRE